MPGGFDPTGYVKGWAAQQALAALVSPGVSGAIVNAAGDIASFGGPAGTNPFRFGIVDPLFPGKLACIVELTGALATSGTYERGEHLIDPHSGEASVRVASASVSGPDLGLADALATALAVAGVEGLARVEQLGGYEAMTISFDGTKQLDDTLSLRVIVRRVGEACCSPIVELPPIGGIVVDRIGTPVPLTARGNLRRENECYRWTRLLVKSEEWHHDVAPITAGYWEARMGGCELAHRHSAPCPGSAQPLVTISSDKVLSMTSSYLLEFSQV